MTLTNAQSAALEHIRAAYVGPEGGDEEVLLNRPHLQYSVGMLFPPESTVPEPDNTGENAESLSGVQDGDVEEDGGGGAARRRLAAFIDRDLVRHRHTFGRLRLFGRHVHADLG